jgi:hypothetical protein
MRYAYLLAVRPRVRGQCALAVDGSANCLPRCGKDGEHRVALGRNDHALVPVMAARRRAK